jgi:hypothetical protein
VRELNDLERANVAFLSANDVPHGLLEVTATGLAKSILDATQPFREFLQAHGIHDYDRQAQGPDFKVMRAANVITNDLRVLGSLASMYRPHTKHGDPRVWFRELGKGVAPQEIIASIWARHTLWIVNISRTDIATELRAPSVIRDLLADFVSKKAMAVDTLLDLLRSVAEKGYLPAPVRGPTAVGRLLESELGIEINSRRDPDFMGIEIKSSRNSLNRTTLFAKTPDWSGSKYKSSRALLDAFGYDRSGQRKLSCTISGIATNSQGLSLFVDENVDLLKVMYEQDGRTSAVQWEMDVLRHTLATKHNETFWVKAESKVVDGWEYIRFTSAQHTQKPLTAQLTALLQDGKVTVDFLIREKGDKGYLFKLLPKNLSLLFPPAVTYRLIDAETAPTMPQGEVSPWILPPDARTFKS